MGEPRRIADEQGEVERLRDEVEQLRTALEASEEEGARLADDRARLLSRLTSQSRDMQAADSAYRRASAARDGETLAGDMVRLAAGEEQEELRVAFEETQVLTEELEAANEALRETNRALDGRVAERTRELAAKNAALTESERLFRTLVEGMPQLVWRALDGGRWTWASPQWESYTGQRQEQSLGRGWMRALHPDDRDAAQDAWARASPDRPLDFEARVLHAAEGRHRHFRIRASPVLGDDGEVVEWLGTSTDVDDLRGLHERQRVLVAELQHRVRNILTVIRSVFARTMDAGGDMGDLAEHFVGRLDSLARTQVVVTQSAGGLVNLENLIRDELLSVGAADGPGLEIGGPEVALSPKAAESIGLAVHELTTNALKYGALKKPGPTLEIRWDLNMVDGGGRRLVLLWMEKGVPAVPFRPARQGFGSELITEALPYRLGAETSLEFRGGGVRCLISVPLPPEGASAAAG